ncbi:MAG: hypothetical protein FK733_10350 [Asgard group archaeon]|nr:hypothetical protein [Asgard group archaeon]
MRKTVKLFLLIATSFVLLSPVIGNAVFTVTDGTIYTFDLVKSQQTLQQGTDSGQGTGLMFGGNPFSVGLQFTVEILTHTATSVQWEIDVAGNTAVNTDSDTLSSAMSNYLFYPYLIYGGFGTWDQAEVEMGPFLMLGAFFFEPVAFKAFFQGMHDNYGVYTPMSYWTFNDIQANFDSSTNIAVFDWVFNAEYNDTGCDMYFEGDFYFNIAYDQTTGVLMGYNFDINYAGYIALDALSIDLEQTIEQVGYNLPKNQFKVSGFTFIVAIPVIFGLSLLVIKNRKKK